MGILDKLLGGGGGNTEGNIKSPTTTTTQETRAATGQSYADRGSQAISGFQLQDNATVTLTDHGAVDKALNFTKDAIKQALDGSAKANQQTLEAFESANDRAGAVNADQLSKLGLLGLLALAGGLVYLGSRKS